MKEKGGIEIIETIRFIALDGHEAVLNRRYRQQRPTMISPKDDDRVVASGTFFDGIRQTPNVHIRIRARCGLAKQQ
jgi:hypothetical protein